MQRSRSQSSRASRPRPRGRRPGGVLASVRPIVDRLCDRHGVVLWDIGFVREAGQETLRIAVDDEGGITSESLQRFTEDLSRELDEADAVPGDARYLLEVSSPGAERKLRGVEQFRMCRGRPARLTFKDGRPPLEGMLGEVTDDSVEVLQPEKGPVRVGFDEISQARLNVPGV